jgi:flagellar hook-length control protein FliK
MNIAMGVDKSTTRNSFSKASNSNSNPLDKNSSESFINTLQEKSKTEPKSDFKPISKTDSKSETKYDSKKNFETADRTQKDEARIPKSKAESRTTTSESFRKAPAPAKGANEETASELLADALGRFAEELEALEDRLSLLSQTPQMNASPEIRAMARPDLQAVNLPKQMVNELSEGQLREVLSQPTQTNANLAQNALANTAETKIRLEGQIQQLVSETKVELTEVFFDEMQSRFQIEPEQLLGAIKQQTVRESSGDREALVDSFVSKLDIQDPVKRAEAEELYEAYLIVSDTVGKVFVQDLAEKVVAQKMASNRLQVIQPDIRRESLTSEIRPRSPGIKANPEATSATQTQRVSNVEDSLRREFAMMFQDSDPGSMTSESMSASSTGRADSLLQAQQSAGFSRETQSHDNAGLASPLSELDFQQRADLGRVETETATAIPSEEALLNSLSARMNLASIRERLSRPATSNSETTSTDGLKDSSILRGAESKETLIASAWGATAGGSLRDSSAGEDTESESATLLGQVANDANAKLVKNSEFKLQLNELIIPHLGQENVSEISGRAQTLAKAGGGQMKVELTPEGMGSIELKVSVKEGRVDVSILTENQDTKRLLESKLGDLKSSLESHKLNLDQVRVDFTERSNTRENLMDQHNRQSAREFLQDFRQQNDNFRQASFLSGTLDRPEPKDPRVRQFNPKQMTGRPSSSSRRLDLVA